MTQYNKKFAPLVKKLCLLGATDSEIIDFFEITETVLKNWKDKHEEFNNAIKSGKIVADAKVANSMYKRACGYTYVEDKAFSFMGDVTKVKVRKHMPADVNAGKFWLKNRQRVRWQENPTPQQVDTKEPWEIIYTDEDDTN